jgi:hypothetical protein
MIVVGNNTVASQMHKFQTGNAPASAVDPIPIPARAGDTDTRSENRTVRTDNSARATAGLTPRLVPLRFVSPKASPAFCLGASRLRHCSRRKLGTNQLAPYMDNTWLPACGPAAARGPITAARMAPVRPLVGTRTVHVFSSIRRHKFSELWRIRTCDFDSN